MIQRRTPLKRSAKPLKRTPVNRKRPGTRRGPAGVDPDRWRNPGYLAFLREEGRCIACCRACYFGSGCGRLPQGGMHGPCDVAHGPVNGMASKGPDAEACPLCRMHHKEQHTVGWPVFEAYYKIDREKEAAAWWALYQIWKETQE